MVVADNIDYNELYRERLKEYLNAQIEEVYKYKWCMGETMCKDPLEEFTLNDIFIMWVQENAIKFRQTWIQKHGSEFFNGIDNSN